MEEEEVGVEWGGMMYHLATLPPLQVWLHSWAWEWHPGSWPSSPSSLALWQVQVPVPQWKAQPAENHKSDDLTSQPESHHCAAETFDIQV